MTTVAFLDAVRAKHGLDSDNKLARFLSVDRTRISAYRNGRRTLDPEAAVAVAAALELPPEHVFAVVQAERAKRTEHRRIWERLAKLAKHAGAAVVLAYAATSPLPAHASTGADAGGVYILSNRRRRVIPVAVDRRRARRRRRLRAALVA